MTLSQFARGLLFCAGMIGGATTGNLFYLERFMAGAAMLALTATFLFFAMSELTYYGKEDDDELMKTLAEQRQALASIGLLLADSVVDSFKRMGRTMPGVQAELNKLEDDFMPLLSSLKVHPKERERVMQDIEKLRTRSRQDEGRRALTGNRF